MVITKDRQQELLRQAKEALELAEKARKPSERAAWLKLAEAYKDLAERSGSIPRGC